MAVILISGGLPTHVVAQERAPVAPPLSHPADAADPSLGVAFRAGDGPATTVAAGLVMSWPLRPRLHLRGEVTKAVQGIAGCEAEFPSSQRCTSSPVMGVVALSLRRSTGSWAFGLDAGGGMHFEDEAFGGAAPLVQFGGVIEASLGPLWVAETTMSWARAFNGIWEERLGEPLQYVLVGVGIRRRLVR